MADKPGLLEELKRRHVWRIAVAYAVAGWLIVQIATQVFPFFNIPNWGVRLVVILVVIGFPVVVILAWIYELTPEGVRRTEPAGSPEARPEHETRQIGRKLNTVIIAVLVIAVALLVANMLIWHKGVQTGHAFASSTPDAAITPVPAAASAKSQSTPAVFNPPADSIVVLPFKNLSGDPKQAYFSNGITEELTGVLGQNTGLTVIAWETASKFGGGRQTPEQIGKALNVAHILDGSIQREGDKVRVRVELVSTVTGTQLWAAHYDDSFKNIFAVQDRITGAIAGALQVKFAGMQAAPTLNPQAHELYLKGLAALNRYTAANAQNAQDYFQQALKLDPNYADAWAGLSYTYVQLSEISTLPLKDALPKIRAAAKKALAFDPRNANALLDLGIADENDNRVAEAMMEYERAIKLDPSNAHAHMLYGLTLPLKPGLAQFRKAARLNPDSTVVQLNLASQYQDSRDWTNALAAAQAMVKLSPHGIDGAFYLAFAYTQMKRGAEAVKAFDLVQPATALNKQLVAAGRLTYQALLNPSLRSKALATLDHLRRSKFSPDSLQNLIPLYVALHEKEPAIQMLPGLCAAEPIACADLALNPMYAPLHGDPRFEKLAKWYTTITRSAAPASDSSS